MAEALKNQFNRAFLIMLADEVIKAYPGFDKSGFQAGVFSSDWDNLELKQRMRKIVTCLHQHLSVPYEHQIRILQIVAVKFSGFTAMIFPDFVEVFGLNDPDISIPALQHFTMYSSSEFAVRPFILLYPERMIEQHRSWALHENHHVRRLASEGIRPRLPWAAALPFLKKDPSPILSILELLKNDPSEYVRRSVANNLNDISKDHPQLLLQIAGQWQNYSDATDRIIKHACRGLLKKGNMEALSIFGYEQNTEVIVFDYRITKQQLKIGEPFELDFTFELNAIQPQKIRLEYVIGFVKANGKTSEKIFKITENIFGPLKKHHIKRRHSFVDLTTRKHYSGLHYIILTINGQKRDKLEFHLS